MDIERIMQASKEWLVEKDELTPTLYLDFREGKGDCLVFPNLPEDTRMTNKILFMLGRQWGSSHPHDNIASLCFVTEALVSRHKQSDQGKAKKHAKQAKRSLLIQALDLVPEEGQAKPSLYLALHCIEEIRDTSGKFLDLIAGGKPHRIDAEGKTECEAFLAGFVSSRMSGEKQRAIIEKAKKHGKKQRIAESWGIV